MFPLPSLQSKIHRTQLLSTDLFYTIERQFFSVASALGFVEFSALTNTVCFSSFSCFKYLVQASVYQWQHSSNILLDPLNCPVPLSVSPQCLRVHLFADWEKTQVLCNLSNIFEASKVLNLYLEEYSLCCWTLQLQEEVQGKFKSKEMRVFQEKLNTWNWRTHNREVWHTTSTPEPKWAKRAFRTSRTWETSTGSDKRFRPVVIYIYIYIYI